MHWPQLQGNPLCRRLKWIALAVVFVALAAATPAPAASGGKVQFAAGISDLPLMAGLSQQTDRGYVFDKPDGRIVEVVAHGRVSVDAVRDFYLTVLPEFGWRRGKGPKPETGLQAETGGQEPEQRLYFEREGERLRLAITQHQAKITLHFTLTPGP